MRFGVSLPYRWLVHGGEPLGDREALFELLKKEETASVELRHITRDTDPAEVKQVVSMLLDRGFRVTVHGAIKSAESAPEDLFTPLRDVLPLFSERRMKLTVTAHPPCGEVSVLARMLRDVSDHIRGAKLPAVFALENNRLLPDKLPGDCAALVSAAVRECGREEIGICFDMGHWYYHCIKDLGDENALPDEFFLSRVIHTHIHSTHDLRTHFPLGHSNDGCVLPLKEYVDALGIGYEGVYNIELDFPRFEGMFDPPEALTGSVCALNDTVSFSEMAAEDARLHLCERLDAAARRMERIRTEEPSAFADEVLISSSYLFRCGGTEWGVDAAMYRTADLPGVSERFARLFAQVEYMLVTHGHADHIERRTTELLAENNKKLIWVIPDFLAADAVDRLGVPAERIQVIHAGETVRLGAITVTAFESRHRRPENGKGVDELGYYVTAPDSPSVFLPGDIRDYSADTRPAKELDGKIDLLFAHVWLGDDHPKTAHCDPYDRQAAEFFSAYRPKKVVFAHLYAIGRNDKMMWRREHAELIAQRMADRTNE